MHFAVLRDLAHVPVLSRKFAREKLMRSPLSSARRSPRLLASASINKDFKYKLFKRAGCVLALFT